LFKPSLKLGLVALVAATTGLLSAVPASAATVSLSGWRLTLPVNSSGGTSGNAAVTLNPAAVKSPWLVRNSDGSLTFWAPTKGATTTNSKHPRTELVSTSDWSAGSGTHTLNATLKVQQLPGAHDIIIGQIHCGGSTSSIPLLMLHYNNGNVTVAIRTSPTVAGTDNATILTGIPLNATFSYTITSNGSDFTMSASYNGRSGSKTIAMRSAFKGYDVRWQAGDYQQGEQTSSGTDGGRMTISSLTKS
jgi:hypothetical protein